MATDFSKPISTDGYAGLLAGVKQAFIDLARGLEPGSTGAHTNLPTGAIRWNSANQRWDTFSGTSWGALSLAYGISIGGNAATATTATNVNGGTVNATTGDFSGTVKAGGVLYALSRKLYFNAGGTAFISDAPDANWGILYRPSQNGVIAAHGWLNAAGSEVARLTSVGDLVAQRNVVAQQFQANAFGGSVQFGGGAAAGFYADSANVAIRCTSSGGLIYFQGLSGAATWATVGPAGFYSAAGYAGPATGLTGTAASLNAGLGAAQSWGDYTSARAGATVYTNSTGRTIEVSVTGKSGSGATDMVAYVAGVQVGNVSSSNSVYLYLTFAVPAGHQYQVNNGFFTNITTWAELR